MDPFVYFFQVNLVYYVDIRIDKDDPCRNDGFRVDIGVGPKQYPLTDVDNEEPNYDNEVFSSYCNSL